MNGAAVRSHRRSRRATVRGIAAANPRIPGPGNVSSPRRNSHGLPVEGCAWRRGAPVLRRWATRRVHPTFRADSRAEVRAGGKAPVRDPSDRRRVVGAVAGRRADDAGGTRYGARAQHAWDALGGDARAAILERAADLFEQPRASDGAPCAKPARRCRTAGEVREAVDFLRYYAAGAPAVLGAGVTCRVRPANATADAARPRRRSPASARGISRLRSSPDRSPARSRRATPCSPNLPSRPPLIAAAACAAARGRRAGGCVLHLLPGDGRNRRAPVRRCASCGRGLHRLDGSGRPPSTARWPRARRPIATLIAETGGQNAMIVDFDGAARTGGARCGRFRLRQRRPALLGLARAVPAGRCRRQDARDDPGRDGRARHRRSADAGHRYRPGDRRSGAQDAAGARRAA